MRPDHIKNHDRRLHMARCYNCGTVYDMADGECPCCDCEDEDFIDDLEIWIPEPGR
ncbi:MAG: hypothetical protein U9Q07_03965 [Planctomycetota bacterium]|nr:hypothetical protein [Planctomycetota bacterium]